MKVSDWVKLLRSVREVLKAARSAMRMAGAALMLPRSEIRRPAWSGLGQREMLVQTWTVGGSGNIALETCLG